MIPNKTVILPMEIRCHGNNKKRKLCHQTILLPRPARGRRWSGEKCGPTSWTFYWLALVSQWGLVTSGDSLSCVTEMEEVCFTCTLHGRGVSVLSLMSWNEIIESLPIKFTDINNIKMRKEIWKNIWKIGLYMFVLLSSIPGIQILPKKIWIFRTYLNRKFAFTVLKHAVNTVYW